MFDMAYIKNDIVLARHGEDLLIPDQHVKTPKFGLPSWEIYIAF